MKNREKIILIIAIIALCYGALDYFILSSKKNGTNVSFETESQFSKILITINENFIRLKTKKQKNKKTDYLITMIESEWENDPFSNLEKFSKKNRGSLNVAKKMNLNYSGFIKLGNKILAVIDGIEYTTGEQIQNSNYKIIKITPKIVLINNNLNEKIVLYLKEG